MNAPHEDTGQILHPPEVIAELAKNRQAYNALKPQFEVEHWGRTVLLHDGDVVAIYNDEGDAYEIGCEKFGPGHFSLHKVGERPVNLGFHSVLLRSSE
jgi:hypothetical protein